MSDSDCRDTDKLPPRMPSLVPPSDHFRVAELGNALLALDTMAIYLRGELRGQAAEVANEIGTMMRRKQDVFEARVTGELDVAKVERQQILDKLDVLVSLVTTLTESITEDHQKVVSFMEWRTRFEKRHCEECVLEREAKEA